MLESATSLKQTSSLNVCCIASFMPNWCKHLDRRHSGPRLYILRSISAPYVVQPHSRHTCAILGLIAINTYQIVVSLIWRASTQLYPSSTLCLQINHPLCLRTSYQSQFTYKSSAQSNFRIGLVLNPPCLETVTRHIMSFLFKGLLSGPRRTYPKWSVGVYEILELSNRLQIPRVTKA